MSSSNPQPQGPPSNSSKLDKILHRLIQHYHAIGQLKTPPNKTDFKKAKTELEALLQSERQSLLAELGESLPETVHAEYCDLNKQWNNPEDVLCSCDKNPQDRYRDQVLTIIKELNNPSGATKGTV